MPKTNYQNFNQFILRTPLYPLDFLQKLLGENIDENQLNSFCNNPIVKEAIFLASPNLYSKIEKWLNDELTDKKELINLPQAIYKYLARMSSRCTPFGLFAGNSVGEVKEKTNLTIPAIKDYRRVTRLDMNYLCSLAQDLLNDKEIREQTLFYPNNSIYQFGDKLRYTEYYYHNTKRVHHIAAVDCSDYLLNVLGKARGGAKIIELAEADDMEIQVGGFLETRLGFTAAAHLALASKNIVYYDFDTPLMMVEDPVIGGIKYGPAGKITLPETPGLGATFDPDFLTRLKKKVIE